MDASAIINDNMTLEEKLKAIDEAIEEKAQEIRAKNNLPISAPLDPADLTICVGCQ